MDLANGSTASASWVRVCVNPHAHVKFISRPSLWAVAEMSLQRVNWLSRSTCWKQTTKLMNSYLRVWGTAIHWLEFWLMQTADSLFLKDLVLAASPCFPSTPASNPESQSINYELAVAAVTKLFETVSHLSNLKLHSLPAPYVQQIKQIR